MLVKYLKLLKNLCRMYSNLIISYIFAADKSYARWHKKVLHKLM
jgi:hypothetical protein